MCIKNVAIKNKAMNWLGIFKKGKIIHNSFKFEALFSIYKMHFKPTVNSCDFIVPQYDKSFRVMYWMYETETATHAITRIYFFQKPLKIYRFCHTETDQNLNSVAKGVKCC